MDYSEEELIDMFENRAAMMEFEGDMTLQQANQRAYFDIRAIVGERVPMPEHVRTLAAKFTSSSPNN